MAGKNNLTLVGKCRILL